jgi:hypothetical protein
MRTARFSTASDREGGANARGRGEQEKGHEEVEVFVPFASFVTFVVNEG